MDGRFMNRDLRIALTGLGLLALALGIGRFLLTPLLPLMHEQLGVSLVGGGWMASLNNLGYLIGSLGCALVALRHHIALRVALVVVALSTLGMGLVDSMPLWFTLRLVTGIASAVLVVHGISFALTRLSNRKRRSREALVFTGTGIGIVVSGIFVAVLKPAGLTAAVGWIVFGCVGLVVAGTVWRTLTLAPATDSKKTASRYAPSGPAWSLVVCYALLGFSYIIPATFLPIIAGQQLHRPLLREWFWPLYGSATILATLLLSWLPEHVSRRRALAVCCTSLTAGILLVLLWPTVAGFILGTIMIGGVTMPVVLLVMGEARRLAPSSPTRLIAVLTAGFSIGQMIAPLLAGWLAQSENSFNLPLTLAAVASGVAIALNLVGELSKLRIQKNPTACTCSSNCQL